MQGEREVSEADARGIRDVKAVAVHLSRSARVRFCLQCATSCQIDPTHSWREPALTAFERGLGKHQFDASRLLYMPVLFQATSAHCSYVLGSAISAQGGLLEEAIVDEIALAHTLLLLTGNSRRSLPYSLTRNPAPPV